MPTLSMPDAPFTVNSHLDIYIQTKTRNSSEATRHCQVNRRDKISRKRLGLLGDVSALFTGNFFFFFLALPSKPSRNLDKQD